MSQPSKMLYIKKLCLNLGTKIFQDCSLFSNFSIYEKWQIAKSCRRRRPRDTFSLETEIGLSYLDYRVVVLKGMLLSSTSYSSDITLFFHSYTFNNIIAITNSYSLYHISHLTLSLFRNLISHFFIFHISLSQHLHPRSVPPAILSLTVTWPRSCSRPLHRSL